MKIRVLLPLVCALSVVCVSDAWADCEAEEDAVLRFCHDKTTKSECLEARRDLLACKKNDGGDGGGGGETGPTGSFIGEFGSAKIKNKATATGCETRTAIPGTLVVAANGTSKLTGTFSDNVLNFKGKRTKKGFELSAKSGKTVHKFVGKNLSSSSATVDYSITRKKGKTKECSAKYLGTLGRQI